MIYLKNIIRKLDKYIDDKNKKYIKLKDNVLKNIILFLKILEVIKKIFINS